MPKSPSRICKGLMITVTYLAIFQKDVLRLHVPVQDFTLVQVKESQGHLDEPVKNLVLGKVLALGRLDFAVDVSAIAVDHDDVKVLLSINVAVFVRHNIRMPDFLKEANL